ncbi:response regulator [Flavobacterium sp. TSSA_36]|jgi:CheY-like chemotaxis protein|uniref:response regulator n=1 Tax=Flavobacterium sp. TSSA_36 TaxID=3447669 RepID=UPI003F2E3E40
MFNTILCIDDDPISLMISKKIISKIAFAKEVVTALNGEEALNFYKSAKDNPDQNPKIDLIFLDLNMPVMGGWKFLEIFTTDEYNKFNKNTRVIIISSTVDPQDLAKAKIFPIVTDFLPKPITIGMLEYLNEKLK